MKNVALILVVLLLIGCNKENGENQVPTDDYRDKFIGSYQCTKTGVYHCGDSIYHYEPVDLVVTVTKKHDSLINILDAVLKINKNGEFGGLYPDSAPDYHGFGGYFINDSIFFNTHQGGLGCFTAFDYEGKKYK